MTGTRSRCSVSSARLACLPMNARMLPRTCSSRSTAGLRQFRGEAQLSTWIYRIAARHASHLGRRRRVRSFLSILPWHETEPEPQPDPAEKASELRLLDRLLDKLSPKKRMVLVLFEIEGLGVNEIANVDGMSCQHGVVRLRHARAELVKAAGGYRHEVALRTRPTGRRDGLARPWRRREGAPGTRWRGVGSGLGSRACCLQKTCRCGGARSLVLPALTGALVAVGAVAGLWMVPATRPSHQSVVARRVAPAVASASQGSPVASRVASRSLPQRRCAPVEARKPAWPCWVVPGSNSMLILC